MRRVVRMLVIVAIAFALGVSSGAAQPAVAVDEALALLVSAGGSASPVADRVSTTVFREDGTFSSVTHTVRWVGEGEDRRLSYEIASFRFYAERGLIEGEFDAAAGPRASLVVERDGVSAEAMLTGVVPVGPMPQFWTVGADGSVVDPALGLIRFEEVSRTEGEILLIGGSPGGTVALVLDAATGRMTALEAQLRDGTLSQRAAPVDAGEPASWRIPREGRRIVSRLDQLMPAAPPIVAGSLVPDWSLRRVSGDGVSLDDWLAEAGRAPGSGPWRILLIADGAADPGSAIEAVARRASELADRAAVRGTDLGEVERFWLRHRAFGIVVIESRAYEEGRAPVLADAPPLPVVFSTQRAMTLDLLPVGLGPIALAVDADRVIGAVVPLDDAGRLEELLDAMLSPSIDEPSPP
ncbi:MAG: hypothetical protein ACTS22_01030 [Phycisphaerales bacterium]